MGVIMLNYRRFLSAFKLLITLSIVASASLAAKNYESKLINISFTEALPTEGRLVIGVYGDGSLDSIAAELNKATNSAITSAISKVDFKGKRLSTAVITAPAGTDYNQMLLLGLGDKENFTALDWQKLGDIAMRHSVKAFKKSVPIALNVPADGLANMAMGAGLGGYYFDKYFTDEKRHKRQLSLTMVGPSAKDAKTMYTAELEPVVKAIWHTRDVSNEPGNIIYPQQFVERWEEHFDDLDNIKIRVLDEDDMRKLNMGAIYGVGRGSERPPRIMIVEYMAGKKGDKPLVLVGKGITFDTGGISLKNPPNMWNMKFDMSGAASVMGTLHALAGRSAKVNAVAIAALAENMPGGDAQRPGDIVPTMSGKTVSIRSTDAEGRLVLADAVFYAEKTYNPELLVDLATLTGSASRALGKDYAAMFSRHNELVDGFINAGKATSEEVWQLPLNDNHFKAVEHSVSDVMNSGPSAPGASAGAAFIGSFIKETTPWVHFDIAGVAYGDDERTFKASPGSRSFGVLMLNQYVKDNFEK